MKNIKIYLRIKYIYIIFASAKENRNITKTAKTMKTQAETTPYVIDYIYNNTSGINYYYHQLVRRADNAILYANQSLENVFLRCWELGIPCNEVVIL